MYVSTVSVVQIFVLLLYISYERIKFVLSICYSLNTIYLFNNYFSKSFTNDCIFAFMHTFACLGFTSPAGSFSCCPAGSYRPDGSTSCSTCPSGTSSYAYYSVVCCAAGSYAPPGTSTCSTCPSGTSSVAGAAVCCALGYFATPGSTTVFDHVLLKYTIVYLFSYLMLIMFFIVSGLPSRHLLHSSRGCVHIGMSTVSIRYQFELRRGSCVLCFWQLCFPWILILFLLSFWHELLCRGNQMLYCWVLLAARNCIMHSMSCGNIFLHNWSHVLIILPCMSLWYQLICRRWSVLCSQLLCCPWLHQLQCVSSQHVRLSRSCCVLCIWIILYFWFDNVFDLPLWSELSYIGCMLLRWLLRLF